MYVVQTTHSKSGLKRPDRPCDSCRRRKSRCVFAENDAVCFLCRFHNYECIFSDSPVPRKRHRRTSDSTSVPATSSLKDGEKDKDKDKESEERDSSPPATNNVTTSTTPKEEKRRRTSRKTSANPTSDATSNSGTNGALSVSTGEPTTTIAAGSSVNVPPVTSSNGTGGATPDSSFPDYDFLPHTLLRNTLGLQCRRYISYIGSSAEHDPVLMPHYGFDSGDRASLPPVGPDFQTRRQVRRVQNSEFSQTSFVVFESEDLFRTGHPNPSGRDDTIGGNLVEVHKIQDIVGNFGRQLVGLYFRIVHPSFPILHKEEFLEKYYRNPSELSPSLLAGLYVFAINWWTYDPDLVPFPRPPQSALEALAQINLYREIDRPTLSTVQAGILLLQHQTFRNQVTRPSHSWAMLGEIVAVAQEVGLHLDPSNWAIPEWERGLRKRLAWGLFIQDKWMALTFGRPSNIHSLNWTVSELAHENFPHDDGTILATGASTDDEPAPPDNNGSVNRETGKVMFMNLVVLTQILSDILDTFHSALGIAEAYVKPEMDSEADADESIVKGLLAKARPLQIRLKDWIEQLPDCLRMENTALGELSASGNLHLGYHAAQIALLRPVLSALGRIDLARASLALTEIYDLIYRSAFSEFVAAVAFVHSLKPQHIQTFWYAASKNNFAVIATFGVILMFLAKSDADRAACVDKLAEYQWMLKVNVRGAEFLQHAILWVEECKHLLKTELTKRSKPPQSQTQQPYQVTQVQQQTQQFSQQQEQLQQHIQQQQLQQQQGIAILPSTPSSQHPLQHLQHLQQQLHMQRQQQQQQQQLRSRDITSTFPTGEFSMNLNSSINPLHSTPSPQAQFIPARTDSDIFFTSLVTDGRTRVINQHASTGVDELDNLEFFNMRMLSHPWETQPADVSPGTPSNGTAEGAVQDHEWIANTL